MALLEHNGNPSEYYHAGRHIQLTDAKELVQGGPETVILVINGTPFEKARFGTNVLLHGRYLILPMYKWSWRRFSEASFKICVIDLVSGKWELTDKPHVLAMPYAVTGNQIHFYTNLDNTKSDVDEMPFT